MTKTRHSCKRFGQKVVAETTNAASKRIGETIKMENTVKNHAKVLEPTDSVDEGHKTGLTSCRTR